MDFVINFKVGTQEADGRTWTHVLTENISVTNFEYYSGTWPCIVKRLCEARLHNRFANCISAEIDSINRVSADGIWHDVDPEIVNAVAADAGA